MAVTDWARSEDRRERQTETGVWVMETLGNRNMGKKYNKEKEEMEERWVGGDEDLSGRIRYHYNCCDVKEGGGFP
jgi:hypothetical protein